MVTQLEAGRQRGHRRQHALVPVAVDRESPSSGSSAIVWPRLTFLPPIVASRTASVTTTRLDRPAGLGHRADVVGGVERRVERQQRREALGGVAGRDDDDRPLGHRRDLARGQDDVRVVGQEQDLARRRPPRPPRAARRCSGWPTGRPGRRPRRPKSRKIAARPSPAVDGDDREAGQRPQPGRRRPWRAAGRCAAVAMLASAAPGAASRR